MAMNNQQKYVIIRHQNSGLVLDAREYEVKLQHFVGNSAQQWKLEHIELGRFLIINKKSGKVLDIEGGADSLASLITYRKHGDVNQQWHVNGDGTIECPRNSLVLDIAMAKFSAGTNIIAYPKHGEDNQKFQLQSMD